MRTRSSSPALRSALLLIGVGLAALGIGSAAMAWDARLETALSVLVLVGLLAALTLLFPLFATALASVASSGRVPVQGGELVMPALLVLAVALGIAFVPVLHPTGATAAAVAATGIGFIAIARWPAPR